ncbi:MAG: hypothetical protein U0K71_10675 [Paludibacteraceae bacterium]|nr:hypothetical protein [Paludibacteraceae bacterium]
MKKATYILSIIILSLLSVGATVQAQILEKYETKTLLIYPSDFIVEGSFKIKTDNPLKDYFININGVIRIGDNSIKLKKKDQPRAKTRIEVNKGRLNLGGKTKIKYKHDYERTESVSEGKLDNPIDIDSWSVNRLSIEDKDITISIYDNNTGQLLEEKKYKLKPDSVRGGPYTKLCYTNLAGEEVKFMYGKIGDDIDYSKPMKIVAEDIWDRSYKVCSYNVKDFHSMCGMWSNTTNGDTLDKDIIRKLPKGHTMFISDIIIEKEGIRRMMSPIEIRK